MKLNKNKTNGTETKKQKIKTVKFKEIKDKKKGAIAKHKDKIVEFLKLGGMFGAEAAGKKILKTVLKTSTVGKAATIIFTLVATIIEAVQIEKLGFMLYAAKYKMSPDDLIEGINEMTNWLKNLSDEEESEILEHITNKLAEELSEEELNALADFIKNAKKGGEENDDTIIDLD